MPGKGVLLNEPEPNEHSADNAVYMNVSRSQGRAHQLGLKARLASLSVGGPTSLWCPNTGKKQFDPSHTSLPDRDATLEDYDNEDIYMQFEEIYHSVSDAKASSCIVVGTFHTRSSHGSFSYCTFVVFMICVSCNQPLFQ